MLDGVLSPRVANLGARGVGGLFGEPTRPNPRFEDPLDSAGIEGVDVGAYFEKHEPVYRDLRDLAKERLPFQDDVGASCEERIENQLLLRDMKQQPSTSELLARSSQWL